MWAWLFLMTESVCRIIIFKNFEAIDFITNSVLSNYFNYANVWCRIFYLLKTVQAWNSAKIVPRFLAPHSDILHPFTIILPSFTAAHNTLTVPFPRKKHPPPTLLLVILE